jgi:hypothetical protein
MLNADGTGDRELEDDPVEPNWSPDSALIAFTNLDDRAIDVVDRVGATSRTTADPATVSLPTRPGRLAARNSSSTVPQARSDHECRWDRRHARHERRSRSADWQPLVGPQRSDYKNAAQFCKAERDFMGGAAFAQKYGTNGNGAKRLREVRQQ